MRTRLLATSLALAVLATAAAWLIERNSSARLRATLAAARAGQRELAALQAGRNRLAAEQPTTDELAVLRQAAAERDSLVREITARTAQTRPASFVVGEPVPQSSWANRGAATPRAAIETALWAAAGGDLDALKPLLGLPDATREKARALLASLPDDLRSRYATPEDLVAAFTAKDIPLGEAQLTWFNQTGDDDATAGVLIRKPARPGEIAPPTPTTTRAETPRELELRAALSRATSREEVVRLATQLRDERAARSGREPPQLPDTSRSNLAMVALHREKDGWRLVVPPAAVDRIARELRAPAPL
jgi:hypothetical protein